MRRFYCIALLAIASAARLHAGEARDPHESTDAAGRTPAEIMSHLGAQWLDRPEREAEEQPDRVIAAMNLKPGDVVADIGSGSGYFTVRLARAVGPAGKVYAVDVQPEMNALLERRAKSEGIENIEILLGSDSDPKLPPASLDWILLVDTYHEFQQPRAMLDRMRAALKPEGRVALVEYRLLGDTAKHIRAEHRMSVAQVLAEWNPAGFELRDLLDFLPSQHLFLFGRRADPPPCP